MFNTYTCFGQRKIKIKSCCTCVYLQVEASKPFFYVKIMTHYLIISVIFLFPINLK